jgi:hypothetical protein
MRMKTYGKAHSIICFDSLYEQREYELISSISIHRSLIMTDRYGI